MVQQKTPYSPPYVMSNAGRREVCHDTTRKRFRACQGGSKFRGQKGCEGESDRKIPILRGMWFEDRGQRSSKVMMK